MRRLRWGLLWRAPRRTPQASSQMAGSVRCYKAERTTQLPLGGLALPVRKGSHIEVDTAQVPEWWDALDQLVHVGALVEIPPRTF